MVAVHLLIGHARSFLAMRLTTVSLGIRDYEELGFPDKNITLKQASFTFHDNLPVLFRHHQAQKCLQSNPNPFKKVFLWN